MMKVNVYQNEDYGGFWRRGFADVIDGLLLLPLFLLMSRNGEELSWGQALLSFLVYMNYLIASKAF